MLIYQLQISSNGLVTLNRRFYPWWPIPFPYGISLTAIIAPYWIDLDFRNNLLDSGVYYHFYDVRRVPYRRRAEEVMYEFERRLDSYSGQNVTSFDPRWLLVVTWKDASPYPAFWYGHEVSDKFTNALVMMLFSPQTMTCQLVLATDYISTYGLFLYYDNNWNISQRYSRPVTIGYDARNFIDYEQVKLPNQRDYYNMDAIKGNTDLNGEWYFNFTSGGDTSPSRNCHKWSHEHINLNPIDLSCPCTLYQALLDWRFWFGYFWGVSSRPNCATFILSQLQGTTECCYDSNGSLIVGSRYGGSYFQYNPLFYYQLHFLKDHLPHKHCCIESKLCQIYYKHRPSNDCHNYRPPKPCK